ncbi:putative Flagellar basal-body protein [Pseudomonas amygdali pv. mori]|uniref:Putative Flagellar basal-body protein n=1 Tax=Pseudomonas amygdali pv. mori TaxID=34065 RepID=A0A3M4L3F7_PSEA0|nr:putative Flagellar basal-body protein [Pseudomonas amygdali pv. mori]RMR42978.1 putative Flagellar basal-body protein [Pseudomonas amygdali pv. mori]RMT19651.1 putative Flagellar basal-body protein [Pseudomonas amygdali pv. mori]
MGAIRWNPNSVAPLHVTLEQRPNGSLSYSGNSQHLRKISDTEFALQGWRPAEEVGGAWVSNGAANGGTVSLPLNNGSISMLDPGDALMDRPVPAFDPSDLKTYSDMFANAIFDSQGN